MAIFKNHKIRPFFDFHPEKNTLEQKWATISILWHRYSVNSPDQNQLLKFSSWPTGPINFVIFSKNRLFSQYSKTMADRALLTSNMSSLAKNRSYCHFSGKKIFRSSNKKCIAAPAIKARQTHWWFYIEISIWNDSWAKFEKMSKNLKKSKIFKKCILV